jgi:hypothetical protein
VPTIPVDGLLFDIKTTYDAQKYDEWDYYRSVLQPQKSYSAMDLVIARAQQSPVEVWLVEAKDFRMITRPPERSNLNGLAETVAKKVSDTLAGLRDAAGAAAQTNERRLAERALTAQKRRVVLHLEPHTSHRSKLFPSNFSSGVLQKLRQVVGHIDLQPLVLNIANTGRAGVPWRVS